MKTSVIQRHLLFLIGLSFIFSLVSTASMNHVVYQVELRWSINENYEVEEQSDGVVLHKEYPDGNQEEYILEEFNADVILSIASQQTMAEMIENLSEKYSLTPVECRRKLKRTINELEEWDIVRKS